MLLRLVRHACAGDKEAWAGDDADRPLDELGLAQAAALAGVLATGPVGRLRSSPTARCRETLRPLALRWGVEVHDEPALGPHGDAERLLPLLRSAAPHDVLCTHGELLRPLLPLLGVKADEAALAKGSVWELEVGARSVTARRQIPNPAG